MAATPALKMGDLIMVWFQRSQSTEARYVFEGVWIGDAKFEAWGKWYDAELKELIKFACLLRRQMAIRSETYRAEFLRRRTGRQQAVFLGEIYDLGRSVFGIRVKKKTFSAKFRRMEKELSLTARSGKIRLTKGDLKKFADLAQALI